MPKLGEEWFRKKRMCEYAGGPETLVGMAGIAVECVDGGEVSDVVCARMDLKGVMVPIFVRGGTRTGRSCGTPPGNRHVLKDVTFRDVTAVAESYVASSVTGVAGCRPMNVRLENVTVALKSGDVAWDGVPPPERAEDYPECNLFGATPARGLYARHVDGLQLVNVVFSPSDRGFRETVVEDDVRKLK